MTPQERELVADLFRRLAALERAPRDPEAERVIHDGLREAPNAVYSLVQTVLLQDEALRMANERIRALEQNLNQARPEDHPRGFLDTMRDAMFGGGARQEERRSSVPAAGGRGMEPTGAPATGGSPWGNSYRDAPPPPPPQGGGFGGFGGMRGPMTAGSPGAGSFLGTAAAVAAGAVGGGLLMDGIRGMLGGGGHHGAFQGAFDQLAAGGGAGASGLAGQAGLGDVGSAGGGASPFGYAGTGSAEDYAQDYQQDVADGDYDDGGDSQEV